MIFFSVYGLWEADKYIRGACVYVYTCADMHTFIYSSGNCLSSPFPDMRLVKPDLRIFVVQQETYSGCSTLTQDSELVLGMCLNAKNHSGEW